MGEMGALEIANRRIITYKVAGKCIPQSAALKDFIMSLADRPSFVNDFILFYNCPSVQISSTICTEILHNFH